MEDLKSILPTGKLNAISARDLAVKLGVSDRVLRDIVTAERVKGVVICSSSVGYYLPGNRDEIREFCNFMEKGQSTHLLQSKALAEHWEKSRGSRHLHPKAWIRTQKEASTQ